MRELNTIESPSASGTDAGAQSQQQFRASFEAALRVNRHHARKYDTRLRVLQQQTSGAEPARRENRG